MQGSGMSGDYFMLREHGDDDKSFNLAVGEPFFLSNHTLPKVLGSTEEIDLDPTYPKLGGDADLLKELRLRHRGQHIVITNGAKQALFAALYALTQVEKG